MPSARTLAPRLLLAALLTAALLAAGSAALFVTSAPAAISLLLEPFSLLLTPGMLIAVAVYGSHDDASANAVLVASGCFYFVVLSVILARRPPPKRPHRPSR